MKEDTKAWKASHSQVSARWKLTNGSMLPVSYEGDRGVSGFEIKNTPFRNGTHYTYVW